MIETIIACIILLETNLITFRDYNEYLDALFLEDEEDGLLLELEFCIDDINEMNSLVNEYIFQEKVILDYDIFGSFLFEKLKTIYYQDKMNIEEFGSSVYRVWQLLPEQISMTEPFWTLSYADDCLSYGDEKQTKELYKKAFLYQWISRYFQVIMCF